MPRINLEDTMCSSHVHRAVLHAQTVDVDNLATTITYMCLARPNERTTENEPSNTNVCQQKHYSEADISRIKTRAHNEVVDSMYGENDATVLGPVIARLFDAIGYFDELNYQQFSDIRIGFIHHLRLYRKEGERYFPYTQEDHEQRDHTFVKDPEPATAHHFFAPLVLMHQWEDISKCIAKRPHNCFMLKRCLINELVTGKIYPGRLRIRDDMKASDYFTDIANANINHLFPPTSILSRMEICSNMNDSEIISAILKDSNPPRYKQYNETSHANQMTYGTRNADVLARQEARNRAMNFHVHNLSREDYEYYDSLTTSNTEPRYRRILHSLLVACNNELEPDHKYDLSNFEL